MHPVSQIVGETCRGVGRKLNVLHPLDNLVRPQIGAYGLHTTLKSQVLVLSIRSRCDSFFYETVLG